MSDMAFKLCLKGTVSVFEAAHVCLLGLCRWSDHVIPNVR